MVGPTVENLLDLHADIRRKVDGGEYVLGIDEISQPTGPSAKIAMQGVHKRAILLEPAKPAA